MSAPIAVAAALLVLGLGPAPALAHTRSTSYSSWELTAEGARVRARIPARELTRLPLDPTGTASEAAIGRYLAAQLRLHDREGPCPLVGDPTRLTAAVGWIRYEWRVRCPEGGVSIESRLLLEVSPSHLHFARARLPNGEVMERVLAEGASRWDLAQRPAGGPDAAGTHLGGYVALGVSHIATGWDHLAFVLALLLLAATLGEVAALVTSFTVAHSVTLALAVLGLAQPQAVAVEALIGFSIALVAAENAWLLGGRGAAVPAATCVVLVALAALSLAGALAVSPLTLAGLALFSLCHFGLLSRAERPARLRAAVAFAFGLVHGFGFAGVLAEMQLPTARVATALFGFNVGVELGQLAAVAIVWPALRALARVASGRWYAGLAELGSAVICGLGVFWFITRAFG